MYFLTFWGGVLGRGGVGFLLASALAGAKAEVEKLTKSIGFYSVICLCALCARMAQTKGRERTTKRHRTQKLMKKRTPRTSPKSFKKRHFGQTRPKPPQDNFPTIFCRSQNRPPPPRQGGARRVPHLHFGSLFLKIAVFVWEGCENRGSRV